MATENQVYNLIECEKPTKRKTVKREINEDEPCDSSCKRKVSCKSVEEREAIANGQFEKCSEYVALLQKMNMLYDCYQKAMYKIDKDVKIFSADFDRAEEDIRMFRSQINSLLDFMENSMIDVVRKKKSEQTQDYIKLMSEISTRKTELCNEISKIESSVNCFALTHFYYLLEEGEMKTESLQEKFNSLSCQINVRRVAFAMNESIINMLKSAELGLLKDLDRPIVKGKETCNKKSGLGRRLGKSKSNRVKESSTVSNYTVELINRDTSCILKKQESKRESQQTKESLTEDHTCVKEEPFTLVDQPIKEHSRTTESQYTKEPVSIDSSCVKEEQVSINLIHVKEEPVSIDLTCVKEEPIDQQVIKEEPNQESLTEKNKEHNNTLVRTPKKFQIKKLPFLKVRSQEDRGPFSICGSTIIDADPYTEEAATSGDNFVRMAFADYNHCTIRIVEIPKNSKYKSVVSHRVTLVSRPWDISCVGKTQLITTVPDIESLLCLKIGPTLTVNRRIQVDGRCRGIDYTNDTLVVTFVNPGCVKILDMDGKVLKTITTDSTGTPLFQTPYYVKTSNFYGSCAFVTDWEQNTVTKIDVKTGKMLDVYLSKEFKRPYGVDIDLYGRVYVCGWETNCIYLVSPDQQQIRPLLSVPVPFTVAVCNAEGKMFISHTSKDSIDVYKLF